MCRNIARTMGMPASLKPGQARRWGDPFYAARTLEKMDPEFEAVLEKILAFYAPEYPVSDSLERVFHGEELEKAKREEMKSLIQLCYRTSLMTDFMLYYYQQKYSDIKVYPDDKRGYFDKRDYIEHTTSRGVNILLEPFRKAFQDRTEYKRLIPQASRRRRGRPKKNPQDPKGRERVYQWVNWVLYIRYKMTPHGLPEAQ